MKKILIIVMILICTATTSFAETSEDVYVRKEVFEVYMQNVSTNMERILNKLETLERSVNENTATLSALSSRIDGVSASLSARIDGVNTSLSTRIDGVNTSLSTRIDGVNMRIDDLRNGIYLWLVVIGTIIALVGVIIAWPKAKDFLQTRKADEKYLTLEEVERLIEARLKTKAGS